MAGDSDQPAPAGSGALVVLTAGVFALSKAEVVRATHEETTGAPDPAGAG